MTLSVQSLEMLRTCTPSGTPPHSHVALGHHRVCKSGHGDKDAGLPVTSAQQSTSQVGLGVDFCSWAQKSGTQSRIRGDGEAITTYEMPLSFFCSTVLKDVEQVPRNERRSMHRGLFDEYTNI